MDEMYFILQVFMIALPPWGDASHSLPQAAVQLTLESVGTKLAVSY